MGIQSLFQKEANCENCGVALPKNQLRVYDPSHQGQYRDRKAIKVCQDCLLTLFFESLQKFDGYAVVVAPIQKYNAFVFYSFDTILKTKQLTRDVKESDEMLVRSLKELLPPADTECDKCSNEARYAWYPSELLNNDPFSWEVNTEPGAAALFLCPECLAREFRKKIKAENIQLYSIIPPLYDSGFLCSWEV